MPSMVQLALGEVKTYRTGTLLGKRDRPTGRAAAQFQDIAAGYLSEYMQLRFRDAPQTPGRSQLSGERFGMLPLIFVALVVPHLQILEFITGRRRRTPLV